MNAFLPNAANWKYFGTLLQRDTNGSDFVLRIQHPGDIPWPRRVVISPTDLGRPLYGTTPFAQLQRQNDGSYKLEDSSGNKPRLAYGPSLTFSVAFGTGFLLPDAITPLERIHDNPLCLDVQTPRGQAAQQLAFPLVAGIKDALHGSEHAARTLATALLATNASRLRSLLLRDMPRCLSAAGIHNLGFQEPDRGPEGADWVSTPEQFQGALDAFTNDVMAFQSAKPDVANVASHVLQRLSFLVVLHVVVTQGRAEHLLRQWPVWQAEQKRSAQLATTSSIDRFK
jgi:hypothetical protein